MAPGALLFASAFAALAALSSVAATPVALPQVPSTSRRVAMPMTRKSRSLTKRDAIPAGLANQEFYYTIDVSLGTPGQPVSLQLDTGSSDVWTFNPDSCALVECVGGTFNGADSSTLEEVAPGGFSIKYGDGSTVQGDYITDNLAIGDVTIEGLEMGLANTASGPVYLGIMGVGYDTNEAEGPYPSIIDQMFNQSIIEHRVYSLWLDDLEAGSGTILFGGTDDTKYSGELALLPIVPDSDGVYREFTVEWVSLSITDSSGTSTTVTPDGFDGVGLFDSGTGLNRVSTDLYNALAAYFGVDTSDNTIDCSSAPTGGYVNFGFVGVSISVPFSELFLPDGNTCDFGFLPSDDETIFADTFLRSAYVYYDLDDNVIGLAQTVFE